MKIKLSLVALSWLLATGVATAQVRSWVDENGVVHFGNPSLSNEGEEPNPHITNDPDAFINSNIVQNLKGIGLVEVRRVGRIKLKITWDRSWQDMDHNRKESLLKSLGSAWSNQVNGGYLEVRDHHNHRKLGQWGRWGVKIYK